MAIVRNLEVDAVIWKYKKKSKRPKRDPDHPWRNLYDENRRPIYEEYTQYYLVKLYNRRCRTNGCYIDKDLVPFFEKLKIRIEYPYRGSRPTAVGCQERLVSKEEWEETELDEVAQRYYKRLKNGELKSMIKLEKGDVSARPIGELKSIETEPLESSDDDWPEEPEFADRTPWHIRHEMY